MRPRTLVGLFLCALIVLLISVARFTSSYSAITEYQVSQAPADSGSSGSNANPAPTETPINFKVAFLGDQGIGPRPESVLKLIKSEGAQTVLHLGDFDYKHKPSAWEGQINKVLGADFPYFSVIGNHDRDKWDGDQGYQSLIQQRFTRLGIAWDGDLGVQSSFTYKGIFFVLVAPKILDKNESHHSYLKRQLAADHALWSIAAWHKNERLMQVGGKNDKVGWELYDAAREGGAIIATAHEHSYSRTHLLSSMQQRFVVSTAETLTLEKGKSFVFVSGLGGVEQRVQKIGGNHWAAITARTCLSRDPVCQPKAAPGALFATFNVDGQANRATFYFKDINGNVRDRFAVISQVEPR